MDIYFRFKDQIGRDFCFNVDPNSKVEDLKTIFEKTPSTLSPSYFYKSVPKSFAVSVNPGFFTCTGSMLFSARATEPQYLKPLDNNVSIKEQITEGQLVVPLWERDNTREFRVLMILFAWLYWDLPDFLSPTPGISLASMCANQLGLHLDWTYELAVFGFHILKVISIYIALWSGVWHPLTLQFWKIAQLKKLRAIGPQELEKLGWTGVRRIAPHEWQKYYQKVIAEVHGGVVNAVKEGAYQRCLGVSLPNGMGWSVLRDTKIDDIKVDDNLLDKNGKFVVSKAYLDETKVGMDDDPEELTMYRTFGYVMESDKLAKVFDTLVELSK